MPKSKRDKKISLTQTKRKGLELKQRLIDDIRECANKYKRIFLFSVHNMRNMQLKDVRQEWNHSRFFFGKNKVMALALGRTAEDEFKDDLHKLSKHLRGQTGLLFTNKTKEDVLKFFDDYRIKDYARSGNQATQTVVIETGPIPEFSHSMEPQLRKLGLPTTLNKGVITLLREYQVCEKDDTLTPEQARILKLFGHQMADFHISVEGMYTPEGELELFNDRPEPIVPPKIQIKAKLQDEDSIRIEDNDDEEESIDEDEDDT
ncbi:mRNA turnover protein 4 homolog isoform X1 [Mytilus trossulus]|uniref:mRNA turnover protein 4 homolog isoform X1 n=2 Tax=Mytilus trossulus TaxID=6551 RepID=UPI0030078CDD